MGFVRVRAADGPAHEFDAPVEAVEAEPDVYVVVDKRVVDSPRPVKYVQPERAPKK